MWMDGREERVKCLWRSRTRVIEGSNRRRTEKRKIIRTVHTQVNEVSKIRIVTKDSKTMWRHLGTRL